MSRYSFFNAHRSILGVGAGKKYFKPGNTISNYHQGSVWRDLAQVLGKQAYFIHVFTVIECKINIQRPGSKLLVGYHRFTVEENSNGIAVNFAIIVQAN